MKASALALSALVTLTLSAQVFGSSLANTAYDCTVVKITAAGPEPIGTMSVSSDKPAQKVEVNPEHDYASCGINKDKSGEALFCLFADANAELRIGKPLVGHIPRVLKRNRLTGQISMTPVAGTSTESPDLVLVLPTTDSTKIYASVCLPARLAHHRQ